MHYLFIAGAMLSVALVAAYIISAVVIVIDALRTRRR
jgi:hypothetical protein